MDVLEISDVGQVSGGARMLQVIGDYMGLGAAAALLLGPGGVPIAIALGLGSATFEITDSFLD